ncbi:MAG TPA: dihydrolipoyl dehydrogenase [Alphaproteobacteria bacterium]
MSDNQFDIAVIGGGPGGYVAAIRAAQLGLKTALVEKEHLGGICLNWGCIPTKALLRSSEIYHTLQHLSDYGFSADNIKVDFPNIIKRSRGVSAQLVAGIKHLMKKNKITVFDGYGQLAGAGKITITEGAAKGTALTAKHIIIATGARARALPGLEPDGNLVWTAREAMMPPDGKQPKSLLVVGSGAIGSEFASFYQNMGTKVTLVEVMDRILPVEDAEVSAFVQKEFTKQGMTVMTKTMVKVLKKGKDNVTATIEADGKSTEQTFDRVIMAVGIVGNVENLGLEKTKVKVEKGTIIIDEYCRTAEPGVYAIGDVAGAPALAHKASHEGIICVEKIAGVKDVHPMNKSNIPGCTYCRPQIASVGLTEAKAKEAGYELKVGKFPFIGNGKAIAMGEPDGFMKTIFDAKTGELLGAHMVGAEVTEMIQGYVISKTNELTEAELMHTIFAHPTMSEMMHETVLSSYGRAIHF